MILPLFAAAGRAVLAASADLLWPRRCAACDRLPVVAPLPFCVDCRLRVTALQSASCCPRCAAPLLLAATTASPRCPDCLRLPTVVSRIRAPYEYGGALGEALLRLKWQGRDDLAAPLGQLLGPSLQRLAGDFELLIPVPLHPQRLRQRGYNQATLLARAALREARLTLPLRPLALVRRRSDPPARAATVLDRFARTRDAFFVPQPALVAGRRVLLVDDVVTTGATVLACARALRGAGALRVEALALLRASG